MLKNRLYSILVCFILVLQGCGALSQKDKALKEFQHDEAQYQPYKITHTIEGYREFIATYPKNLFISDAELQIENLEFAPYEEEDSVEGYMEFTIRYPNNRHTVKASVKIEQAEIKRYEKMDTMILTSIVGRHNVGMGQTGGYLDLTVKTSDGPIRFGG